MIFQHDCDPAHFHLEVRNHSKEVYPGRWVIRGGPTTWPPGSPDLRSLDVFFEVNLKNLTHAASWKKWNNFTKEFSLLSGLLGTLQVFSNEYNKVWWDGVMPTSKQVVVSLKFFCNFVTRYLLRKKFFWYLLWKCGSTYVFSRKFYLTCFLGFHK